MRKSYLSARFRYVLISALYLFFIAVPLQSTLLAQSLSSNGTVPVIEREDMIIAPAPDIGEICTIDPTYTDAHYFKSADRMNANLKSKTSSADFEIDYINSCNGQVWPQQARNALEYALDIWGSHINSTVPIRIRATWMPLVDPERPNAIILGSAGPTRIVQLTGAEPNTWYSIAQASAMTGRDIVGQIEDEEYDIVMNMNCNFNNWYFGTDANTPAGMIDFVTVVLHEVGHGIGFIGSMDVPEDSEEGRYGFGQNNFPIIYDRFVKDGNGISLLNEILYPNPSTDLYEALTGQRNNVFFTGSVARNVYNNQDIPLYTPLIWNPGSSYSHVDENTFKQTENALMRPRIDSAFAMHSPGPIFCGMLSDWGWPLGINCLLAMPANAIVSVENLQQNEIFELDFGVTNIGSFEERSFIISNSASSEEPLVYVIDINSEDFSVIPATNAAGSIDPGTSLQINIRYRPTVDRFISESIQIFHNAVQESSPESPILLSLIGTALEQNEVARLEQNFPNPFNPSTRIPYILSETSNVRLDIYSIDGRLVRTLVNSQQGEGRYEFNLDGSGLSSGVYLYRLIVGNFADTKKFMLVK